MPMKTWLILTWGGWKSKWGKEFFLSWGQQNFIQGQPAPHKYGTIPHQQGASCMYTTNTGMSLSTNTHNTTSTSNIELTAAFSTSAVYRSLSGITWCIHHTPIKRHLKTKSMYTNRQESYTNTHVALSSMHQPQNPSLRLQAMVEEILQAYIFPRTNSAHKQY